MTPDRDLSDLGFLPRPSRRVSLAVSAVIVVVWGVLRLVVFETTVFPLTYAVALLVCVWTRDRLALWGMALMFMLFHTLKMFWLVTPDLLSPSERWTNYGATLTNILAAGVAIQLIIVLRERLEHALADVRAQADELRAQGEELAQQNEELAAQAEELEQQGEELTDQNEELQSQSEEVSTLNEALNRRESLLQMLLDSARLSGSEDAALGQVCSASLDLFRDACSGAAVFERSSAGLVRRALAVRGASVDIADAGPVDDDFVDLVLRAGRTAALDDVTRRPDLSLAGLPDQPSHAVLCAPIDIGGPPTGAFVLYSGTPRAWTEEEFRLADWLAGQCGRVLQTLRMQTDLRTADRRKSEFLATLSHELRNPLGAMGLALEVLESDRGRDEKPVHVLRRQLRQLVRLVDDLIDATRLSTNKIQIQRANVDLVPIVQHAIDAARPDLVAALHQLIVHLPETPIWIDADPDRLAQVVANLLNNATRYTPAGGRIVVELATAPSEIVLTVTDSGIGLAADDLGRVFDMFTQVSGPGSGGLGIGLALVKDIVERHEGHVEATSDGPGRGATFRVRLPRPSGSVTERDAGLREAPISGPAQRVLVVDDNTDSAEMLATLLELHGHEVRLAHDAEQALNTVRDFVPHVALLDIGLPGLSGYELARRLRDDGRTREVRLVALTGWGQEGDRTRAEQAGFDSHLTKPAEPSLILKALRAV